MLDYYQLNQVKEFCERKRKEFCFPTEVSLFVAIQDAMVAAQNTVIAAESLGIGSCYIGDIMERYEEHNKILNLPDYHFLLGCFVQAISLNIITMNPKDALTPFE